MDYRKTIKDLRKRYNNALVNYYGKGYMIFKTIFEVWARDLYQETNLAFRTASVLSLGDKNIDRLLSKGNKSKAIENLTARVNGCNYLSSLMEYAQEQKEFSNPEQMKSIEEFQQIDCILRTLSSQSAERIENLQQTLELDSDLKR